MGSSIQARIFISLALLVMLFVAPSTEAITCSTVVQDMKPCFSYLQSGNGLPPANCCAGVKSLSAGAASTADKQTACGCLKSASKNMKINAQLAQTLPKNCGISLPYPISPSVDCTTIH